MEQLDRRRFLSLAGTTAAALAATRIPGAWAAPGSRPRGPISAPFTLGVASGEPSPDGVVLWTRLAPDPLNGGGMPDRAVAVQWQVATDPTFSQILRHGTVSARPEAAHSVHVELDGLAPGSDYWYRFRSGHELSPAGRTRTAPPAGSSPTQLKFAFVSCQQYEHGYYTAYRHLADEDVDLVIHLGDYIYEYEANRYVAPGGNVRDHIGPETTTLFGYRQRHAQYRTDPDLAAAHAAFPWIMTFDDHEVDNNWASDIPEDDQSRAAFLARRAAAFQAYYEHNPLRRASLPSGSDIQMYRRLTFGDLLQINALDTRQYRSDQACGDGGKPPCPELFEADRTMVGTAQERWLTDGLRASSARWNVLAQQVFFARRDFDPTPAERFSMDAWDGYPGARQRLLDAFAGHGARNPVVLTGDVHASWGANVLANPADPGSAVVASEFVGTSITSGGDGSEVRADTAAVLGENPHIRYFNNRRGYVRCTVRPDRWQTDYRAVDYVSTPGAPILTKASFVVEDGRPGLLPA